MTSRDKLQQLPRNRQRRTILRLRVPDLSSVQPSQVGHVYFFATHDERFVKIGWSSDVHRRWKDIQASHPEPLIFIGVREGTRVDEAKWHRYFRDHRRIGEWFALEGEFLETLLWMLDLARRRPHSYTVTVEDALANATRKPGTPTRRSELDPETARALAKL